MTILSFILFTVAAILFVALVMLVVISLCDGYFNGLTFLAIIAASLLPLIFSGMAMDASEWQVVKSEIVENYTKKETDGGIKLLTSDWSTKITITEWESIKKLEDGKAVLYRQETSPCFNKHEIKVFYKLFDHQGKQLNIRTQSL